MAHTRTGDSAPGVAAPAARRFPGGGLLARRAAAGEQRAFEQIFERHHQELYRYCLAILRDRDDAEDALQSTMAAALRGLPGERRELALRPWLYRVAHNESISILRGRSRRIESQDLSEPIEGPIEDRLAVRDRLRQLVSDLAGLPERQRSAIVMRELSGLGYEEISGALGSTEAAARQTVYEARTALRRLQAGREMECEQVRRELSAHDGRRLRGRKLGAHLESCEPCRDFQAAISQRRSDLQMLFPPLPAVAAAGLLSGILGTAGGSAGLAGGTAATGGTVGMVGAGLAGSAAVKGASFAAAIAVAAGAADVGGVIDLPNPIGGEERSRPDSRGGDGASPGGVADGETDGSMGAGSAEPAANDGGGATGSPAEGTTGTTVGGRDKPGGAGAGAAPAAGGEPKEAGSEGAPGQTGSSSGKSESAPGHGGSSSGNGGRSASASGRTGVDRGKSTEAPGRGSTELGKSSGTKGESAAGADTAGSKGGREEGRQGGVQGDVRQARDAHLHQGREARGPRGEDERLPGVQGRA